MRRHTTRRALSMEAQEAAFDEHRADVHNFGRYLCSHCSMGRRPGQRWPHLGGQLGLERGLIMPGVTAAGVWIVGGAWGENGWSFTWWMKIRERLIGVSRVVFCRL